MWNGDMGNSKYNALTYCDGQNRNECVHKAKAKRRVSAVRVNLLQIKDQQMKHIRKYYLDALTGCDGWTKETRSRGKEELVQSESNFYK